MSAGIFPRIRQKYYTCWTEGKITAKTEISKEFSNLIGISLVAR